MEKVIRHLESELSMCRDRLIQEIESAHRKLDEAMRDIENDRTGISALYLGNFASAAGRMNGLAEEWQTLKDTIEYVKAVSAPDKNQD